MDAQTLFKANILELLGLQNLPQEQQGQMLAKMAKVVEDRISGRVAEALSPAQQADLDTLLASQASPEQIDVFMKRSVPNFDEIAADELLKFKQEMVNNVAAVKKMVNAPAA